MKARYTHKFIIYNKQRIENNYKGLIEKLAEFDSEPIPKDFLENLNDFSELFRKKRLEFYRENPTKMCTIDEILPYSEETNIETNKVLAFIHKYYEFSDLIVGIDYFNGEDEYIEKYFSVGDASYFGGGSWELTMKIVLGHFYGLYGNELNLFLKDSDLEHLIQNFNQGDNMDEKLIYELFGGNELSDDYLTLLEKYSIILTSLIVLIGIKNNRKYVG